MTNAAQHGTKARSTFAFAVAGNQDDDASLLVGFSDFLVDMLLLALHASFVFFQGEISSLLMTTIGKDAMRLKKHLTTSQQILAALVFFSGFAHVAEPVDINTLSKGYSPEARFQYNNIDQPL